MRWLSLALLLVLAAPALAKPPRWETLPLPPAMPKPTTTGTVTNKTAKIFYGIHGEGEPVILLHGGMGNGDHFSSQVTALRATFQVIVIDTRGHGRSPLPKGKLSYHAMAGDVLAVMDKLELEKAAIVGWSDGGAIGLDLAILNPERVSKLFIVGTNYDAKGSKSRRGKPPSATFTAYAAKCRADHAKLGNKPKSFEAQIDAMLPVWRNPGGFTKDQIKTIQAPTMVALGDHDEIIELAQIEEMSKLIPKGQLTVFKDTSHFAMWQDPTTFNKVLLEFLTAKPE
jgi:pimeloyl-ACP methyl ester carboxylesterase